MEELQDAIEDAQYVNAIATQDDGPRPVLPWEKPTEEQLEEWKRGKLSSTQNRAFSLEWTLHQEIGLFLFSSYIKETFEDYCRINFCEEAYRFKKLKGRPRVEKGRSIAKHFLSKPQKDPETDTVIQPKRTEIDEYGLYRRAPESPFASPEQLAMMLKENMDYPTCSESACGLKASVRDEAVNRVEEMETLFKMRQNGTAAPTAEMISSNLPQEAAAAATFNNSNMSLLSDPGLDMEPTESSQVDSDIFDTAERLVLESLRKDYWESFLQSEHCKKLLDFLWYQDRRVSPDDFFVMRVLGRGGFGLVTGMYGWGNVQ